MKMLRSLLYIAFCGITACGAVGKNAQTVASDAVQNIGCKASQSEMWNSLYRVVEEGSAFPAPSELQKALLKEGLNNGLKGANYERFVDAFVSNYSTTIDGIREKFDPKDAETWKKALAEMEVGIRVTELHAELNDQIQASLNKLDSAESALQATCKNPEEAGPIMPPSSNSPSTGTVWDQLRKTQTPEVVGALRTLAVAYQSCDVLKLAPLTAASPSVVGIKDIGAHPQGGRLRSIASLADVQKTDYYIKNQTLAKASCFNVHNDPLIYNFGGKPKTSTTDNSLLDMFTRVNSGGPTLGIDCSAFVFSALTTGGLRLDPDPKKVVKANLVSAIGSGAYKEPQTNGLRCLEKITVTAKTTILPGDIAAINGHVVMVDSVGSDPLAINGITKVADCTTANINSAKFDFTIAQSAPVKNGIGINRYRGADYMPQSATIKNGFISYAVAACKAKFGVATTVSTTNFALVRHAKTAACTAAKPLVMSHEDCVASCQPL